MYQLIYSSVIRKTCTEADISKMLLRSQSQNLQNGITGCIVYHNGEFLHLIEGDKKSVTDLFKRITGDTRHVHVNFLFDSEVDERTFNYSYISGEQLASINALQETLMLSCAQLVELKKTAINKSTAIKFYWEMVHNLCDTTPVKAGLSSHMFQPIYVG